MRFLDRPICACGTLVPSVFREDVCAVGKCPNCGWVSFLEFHGRFLPYHHCPYPGCEEIVLNPLCHKHWMMLDLEERSRVWTLPMGGSRNTYVKRLVEDLVERVPPVKAFRIGDYL